jgi:hypothetical protein
MITVGCSNGSTDGGGGKIDGKYIGKWEIQSLQYNGTDYTFPCDLGEGVINSAGYEFTSTSIKKYINGTIDDIATGVYSEVNILYVPSFGEFARVYLIVGNNMTLMTLSMPNETDNCIKVSKFSWE